MPTPVHMTDGRLVKEARRIFRYLKKIEHLPAARYARAVKEDKRFQFAKEVDDIIAEIGSSDHPAAKEIVKIIQVGMETDQINHIHANIRHHLKFPKNWKIVEHELEYDQD